jgi:hypothetical protein
MKNLVKKIAVKILPGEVRMKLRPVSKRRFLLEKMPKNSICVEIGVFEGDFSEQILKIVKPKKLFLIDPWPKKNPKEEKRYQKVVDRFQSEIKNGDVVVYRSFSHDVIEKFENNFFDWIYLDGGHSYDNLKEQFSDYLPKVKLHGFVTGDDYGREDENYRNNVTRAVDEFISKELTKTVAIKNNQFILKKVKSNS